MSEIKLRNYKKYQRKLKKFIEGFGLKLVYAEEQDDGAFVSTRRLIRISDDLDPGHEIAVTLHEIGHMVDFVIMDPRKDDHLARCYHAFYNGDAKSTAIKTVLNCEKRAWKLGRSVAKRLQIPLGVWFDETERFCLKGYKNW